MKEQFLNLIKRVFFKFSDTVQDSYLTCIEIIKVTGIITVNRTCANPEKICAEVVTATANRHYILGSTIGLATCLQILVMHFIHLENVHAEHKKTRIVILSGSFIYMLF